MADVLSHRVHLITTLELKIINFNMMKKIYSDCLDFVLIFSSLSNISSTKHLDYLLLNIYLYRNNHLCISCSSI